MIQKEWTIKRKQRQTEQIDTRTKKKMKKIILWLPKMTKKKGNREK